jgi:hypoxanthine-DNA glycosylase
MYEVFEQSISSLHHISYPDKIDFLMKNEIALWDVLEVCERDGSGDPDIRNGASNDFHKFLSDHRNIKSVCFNGQKAKKLFFSDYDQRSFQDVTFLCMPSTSPANAGISFEEKVRRWRCIRNCHRTYP